MYTKKLLAAVLFIFLPLTAACTPEQMAAFQAHLASQSADCYQAIDRHFPAGERAWFKGIVHRESRNDPTARNPSGASGCSQLMLPLHNHRFHAVGCSPSQWANPDCNIKAAAHLYREAGRSPWRL